MLALLGPTEEKEGVELLNTSKKAMTAQKGLTLTIATHLNAEGESAGKIDDFCWANPLSRWNMTARHVGRMQDQFVSNRTGSF